MQDDEFMKLLEEANSKLEKKRKAKRENKKKQEPSTDIILDIDANDKLISTSSVVNEAKSVETQPSSEQLDLNLINDSKQEFTKLSSEVSDESMLDDNKDIEEVNSDREDADKHGENLESSDEHEKQSQAELLKGLDSGSAAEEEVIDQEPEDQATAQDAEYNVENTALYKTEEMEERKTQPEAQEFEDLMHDNNVYDEAQQDEGSTSYTNHSKSQGAALAAMAEDYEDPTSNVFSRVAQSKNSKNILAILVLVFSCGIGYYTINNIFWSDEKEQQKHKQQIEERKEAILKEATPIVPEIESSTEDNKTSNAVLPTPTKPEVTIPTPPPPPLPPAPVPPPAPTVPVAVTQIPQLNAQPQTSNFPITNDVIQSFGGKTSSDEEKQKAEARRKAGIIVIGGGAASSSSASSQGSDFLGFSDGAISKQGIQKSAAENVSATYVGDLNRTIAQGKIISAILETAINTDLPGVLRAVVTRDVYAESGKSILVPKGSRVIGSYQVQMKPGQSRVGVKWERLIRPDGIDLQLGSDGVDALGRAGVEGFVDNKFWVQLGMSILTSYIIPMAANKISGMGNQTVTTSSTSGDGASTASTTGSANAAQLQESASKFQEVSNQAVQNAFSSTPTIYVDQGTRINIFVNKDLIFPSDIMSGNQVLK